MMKSAPSIPKRNKELYVPNYEDNDDMNEAASAENYL
jgi:hypothetical protein